MRSKATSASIAQTVLSLVAFAILLLAAYGLQCFTDGIELRGAVDQYVAAGTGAASTQAATTYGFPIGDWCVANVADFSWVFAFSSFTGDISKWNVSSATDMSFMFYESSSFNGNLGTWNVSRVTTMVSCSSLLRESHYISSVHLINYTIY